MVCVTLDKSLDLSGPWFPPPGSVVHSVKAQTVPNTRGWGEESCSAAGTSLCLWANEGGGVVGWG